MTVAGDTLIGVRITLVGENTEMAREQYGKYFEDALGADGINICFECWIDGIMGNNK